MAFIANIVLPGACLGLGAVAYATVHYLRHQGSPSLRYVATQIARGLTKTGSSRDEQYLASRDIEVAYNRLTGTPGQVMELIEIRAANYKHPIAWAVANGHLQEFVCDGRLLLGLETADQSLATVYHAHIERILQAVRAAAA